MKRKLFTAIRAWAVCALVSTLAFAPSAFAAQDKGAQVPKAEAEALQKLEAAPDAATKLKLGGEFIKKYPKSTQRAKVVGYVGQEINKTADAAQKITLLENALTVFKEPTDADVLNPLLFDAYLKANRIDDAFSFAEKSLARSPDDIATLTQITRVGIEQIKQRNAKYVAQTQTYGLKAIQIIEAGNKPAGLSDASWEDYKTKSLPQLYQWLGLVALMTGKPEEAQAKLDKSAALNATDPFTYYLLGSVVNSDYQKLAEQYQKQSPGPLKDSLLQQAQAKMDQVIEFFARTVALSENIDIYKPLHDQSLEDLQSYYKYRHGGSTKGLDELIAKYKKQ